MRPCRPKTDRYACRCGMLPRSGLHFGIPLRGFMFSLRPPTPRPAATSSPIHIEQSPGPFYCRRGGSHGPLFISSPFFGEDLASLDPERLPRAHCRERRSHRAAIDALRNVSSERRNLGTGCRTIGVSHYRRSAQAVASIDSISKSYRCLRFIIERCIHGSRTVSSRCYYFQRRRL